VFATFLAILVVAGLAGVGAVCRQIVDNPRRDVMWGIAMILTRIYTRVVHRLSIDGLHNVPISPQPGKLVVVINHTSGVDPILVQVACPFEIRWMMAADMQIEFLRWAWEWLQVISVDRHGRDTVSAREALRHLKTGGVIGIFPEGAIERPAGEIMPFHAGVGLIVSRSGAPVLPVWIEGTPKAEHAWASLLRCSRSRIRFYPMIRYTNHSPQQIADDLRGRYLAWTGWPANDEPAPLGRAVQAH
jgi:1-acyl-sn-glycerol-3-phosphate acyltransferase